MSHGPAIIPSVRCGNLTAVTRQVRPRVFLDGAVWSEVASLPTDCPAKGQPHLNASGVFLLVDPKTDDGVRIAGEAGSSSSDGFWRNAVARQGSVQAGRRIASAALLDRLHRCSDAAAPGGREASEPNRVGFASPTPLLTKRHQ